MADEGAPEAQPESQGIQVDPRYMIQSLQAKVAQQANDITTLEALATQQQAQVNELVQQLSEAQMQLAEAAQPRHTNRVTKSTKAKKRPSS